MTGGCTSAIWQRFCAVGGITTELLGIHASIGVPRLQVVVFPGNPGSAAYFKCFMLAVHRQLQGQADVLAVTHAGHDPHTNHGGRVWDLRDQIAHKVAFLREHVLLPGRPPVLLVGHSIGAAMMIKAVAEIEGLSTPSASQQQQQQQQGHEVEVEVQSGSEGWVINPLAAASVERDKALTPGAARCDGDGDGDGAAANRSGGLPAMLKLVAVFPFFETNFSGNWRQRRLRSLAPWYDYLGWLGAAVTSLPRALQLAFVRLNAGMDSNAAELTSRLLARHTVRNAFFLASHEFKDLSQPWDWALLAALGRRLHVMGCEADTWLSRGQFHAMVDRVPGLQATWHPDLRHAFCIYEHQSAAVAETVAAVVRSIPDMDLNMDLKPVLDLVLQLDLSYPSQPESVAAMSRVDSSETVTSSTGTLDSSAGSKTAFPLEISTSEVRPSRQLHCHNPLIDDHRHHPHDDQREPCGQTCQQRRQLYGDDVVCGHQHVVVTAPVAAASTCSSGTDVGGDVDEAADQSADDTIAGAAIAQSFKAPAKAAGASGGTVTVAVAVVAGSGSIGGRVHDGACFS